MGREGEPEQCQGIGMQAKKMFWAFSAVKSSTDYSPSCYLAMILEKTPTVLCPAQPQQPTEH